jgi:hypothetical protein
MKPAQKRPQNGKQELKKPSAASYKGEEALFEFDIRLVDLLSMSFTCYGQDDDAQSPGMDCDSERLGSPRAESVTTAPNKPAPNGI